MIFFLLVNYYNYLEIIIKILNKVNKNNQYSVLFIFNIIIFRLVALFYLLCITIFYIFKSILRS